MADSPGVCWIDPDNKHVWWRHICIDGQHTDKLPWPGWKAGNGSVTPSIICMREGCGFHQSPVLSIPPDDWKSFKFGLEDLTDG